MTCRVQRVRTTLWPVPNAKLESCLSASTNSACNRNIHLSLAYDQESTLQPSRQVLALQSRKTGKTQGCQSPENYIECRLGGSCDRNSAASHRTERTSSSSIRNPSSCSVRNVRRRYFECSA